MHTSKSFSCCFQRFNAYICTEPLSVNLVGEREWYGLYEFIEIVRIPELLDYYRSLGMPLKRYLLCKNFALRNFFNYFTKIFNWRKKKGFQYLNIRKHIIYNLFYPNVYLSIIYYLLRILKKFKFKLK